MQKKCLLAVFSAVVMVTPCIKKSCAFDIVEVNKPTATIVVSEDASKADRFAAQELQTYLEKISAVRVPIEVDSTEIEGNMIHIGDNRYVRTLGVTSEDLEPEGFKIKTIGKNLILIGKEPCGTEFAVYTFLEKYLGIRWFWPGELGEVVPQSNTVRVDEIDIQEAPDYKMRLIGGKEAGPGEPSLWGKRNKRGGSIRAKLWGSFYEMLPSEKYAKTHPEYFSLVDGTRKTRRAQLCTTNPEVIKICTDNVRSYFDKYKNVDIFTIEENDWLGFCECENCTALDTGKKLKPFKENPPFAAPPLAPGRFGEGDVISDRMFAFANKMAEELAKTHPDRYVSMSSYSWHTELPEKIKKLHKNLFFQTTSSCIGHWYEPRRQEDYARLKQWAEIADNITIYEYYVNALWPNMFRVIPALIGQSIPQYYKLGARYFYSQGCEDYAISGLNYYVASKLLWDTTLDVKQILEDYYTNCFGNAREPMKKYFETLENAWKDATIQGDLHRSQRLLGTGRSYEQFLIIFKPGILEECSSYLDEAEKLAENELIKKRVEFMRVGLRYNQLTMEAIRAVKKVESLGFPKFYQFNLTSFIPYPIEQAKIKAKQIDRDKAKLYLSQAIDAWSERAEFVDKVKGKGAMDYYSYHRVFDPLETLKQLLDLYNK